MASLTQEQLKQFRREGYLLAEGLLDPAEDLDPVYHEYARVLDDLAKLLYDKGEISSTYDHLPFSERLIEMIKESGKVHAQYFDFTLHGASVTDETAFWVGPEVFRLLRNERLLDAVETLIGPEIYSNPVQHIRLKPPEQFTPKDSEGRLQLGKTPPHQDNGVITPDADQTEMLTVWFPLWDATVENGCLMVWPNSKEKGLLDHCPGYDGLQIPAKIVQGQPKSMPMKRGDVLFMHRLTMHASHANLSHQVRWSFDLRYNPIGQPTGRGAFPGFVARSRAHPETELHDPEEWARLWHETRYRLARTEVAPAFNRWSADSPVCA
jgi:phytanoyl-CoA hydroxylase